MTAGTPNYQTPPKGGMPKWLVILLVILLVVVLGCCGVFTVCAFALKKGAEVGAAGARAAAQVAVERMRDEAVRSAARAGAEAGEDLALPASWPAEVPVYTGFKARFKMAEPGKSNGTVAFAGSELPTKVADFYESELTGKGWSKVVMGQQTEGTRMYKKGGRFVMVLVEGTEKECILSISYGDDGTGGNPVEAPK